MEQKVFISGFGGQGVMLIGQLFGYSACECGLNATFYPAYGPEQRGGTSNCTVTISDEEVTAPNAQFVDTLVLMNEPSLAKYCHRVKKGGTIILNGDLITDKPQIEGVNIYSVPIISIAQEIGNTRVANLVMVGAINGITKVLPNDVIEIIAERKLGKSPEIVEMNKEALKRGLKAVGA